MDWQKNYDVEDVKDVYTKELDLAESERKSKEGEYEELLKAYKGEVKKKVGGRSNAVSRDVLEVILYATPNIVKSFVHNDDVVRFNPRSLEDEKLAEQQTAYANYVFNVKNNGYLNILSSVNNGLLYGNGYLKVSYIDDVSTKTTSYENINMLELEQIVSNPNIEVTHQEEKISDIPEGVTPDELWFMENTFFDITVKETIKNSKIQIETPHPENMLCSADDNDIDEVRFIGEKSRRTISEIISMGYDRKILEQVTASDEDNVLQQDRDDKVTHTNTREDVGREIDFYECYIRYDNDNDGVNEWHRVIAVEDYNILDVSLVNEQPFCKWSPMIEPNSFYGKGLAHITTDIQNIKTALTRETLDNVYLVNRPDKIVYPKYLHPNGVDALMEPKIGNVIPCDYPEQGDPVVNLVTPFVGEASFAMMRQYDDIRTERTGASRQTMGLDPDTLQNATATQVSMQTTASQTKLEMYVRNYAEFCVKMAFKKILRLSAEYNVSDTIIRLRGEYVQIPKEAWGAEMDLSINVGLGTGSNEDKIMALSMIGQQQERIMAVMGGPSPYTDIENIAELGRSIGKLSGIKDTDKYIPNLDEVQKELAEQQKSQQGDMTPKEQADAQNNDAKVQVEQQKLQLEQAKMQLEQQKLQLEQQKIQLEQQTKQAEIQLEQAKIEMQKKIADEKNELERTKIEVNSELETQKMELEDKQKMYEMEQEVRLTEIKINNDMATPALNNTNIRNS